MQRLLANDLPGPNAPRAALLALVTLTGLVHSWDRMALATVLPLVKRDLALTDLGVGLLTGPAFAILYGIASVPIARLADRVSRPVLLAACLVFWSGMTMATGLARGAGELSLARMGVGLGEAGCVPAAHALIGDLYPRRRAMAISLFNAGAIGGLGIGLAVTGVLAERIGWRAAMMTIALAGLPLGVALCCFGDPRGAGRVRDAAARTGVLRQLLRQRRLMLLVSAVALGGCGNFGIAQWLPTYYARTFSQQVGQIGLWLGAITCIGGIAGVLAGGALATRLIRRNARWEAWLPACAYGGSAPFYIAAFSAYAEPQALALTFAALFVGSLGIGVAFSAIQGAVPHEDRATAVSLAVFLTSVLGLALGPLIVGGLSDLLSTGSHATGLHYALTCVATTLFASGLLFGIAAD